MPGEIGKLTAKKLLAAIDKLQSLLPGTAAGQSETLKRELRSLLVEINAIQTELDASVLAIKAMASSVNFAASAGAGQRDAAISDPG
jgi:hypothetical protein